MTILQIPDRTKYGGFMAANHPDLYGPGSPVLAIARPDNAVEVHWPESAGPAPTVEQIMAWEPDPVAQLQEQLDALEEARAGLIRQLRAQVAVALIANGWSQPDTMAAGRDFFASHAADIYGYVSGAAPAFAAAVAIDGREWLDLPAGGGQSIRELFAEALGA